MLKRQAMTAFGSNNIYAAQDFYTHHVSPSLLILLTPVPLPAVDFSTELWHGLFLQLLVHLLSVCIFHSSQYRRSKAYLPEHGLEATCQAEVSRFHMEVELPAQ